MSKIKVGINGFGRIGRSVFRILNDKKDVDIKSELKKKGIQVSGKSNNLLRDIYFYSEVCNVNIIHEKMQKMLNQYK